MSFVDLVLETITGSSEPIPHVYEKPQTFFKRYKKWENRHYHSTIWQMERQGLVKVFDKKGQKFIQCTKKGQLHLLLKKAAVKPGKKWDRQWRIIIFDIPESSKHKRDLLRTLLKKNNFHKLQASVFIHPYPLNREAISYLKESGLIEFIRMMRVDEIDNDKDLRKKFNLS